MLQAVSGVNEIADKPSPEKDALAFTLGVTGDPRRDLFAAIVARDLVLLGLDRRTVSLEETFRKLTTSDKSSSEKSADKKEGA